MLEELENRQLAVLGGALIASLLVGFAGGQVVGGDTAPTGNVAATGDAVSEDEVRQKVQGLMDQQMQRQQQQFQMIAQQSEELSADDLSMDATVTDVSASQFDGLYKVTVSVQGQVPTQQGALQQVDREQEFYISDDGRYLFQQPTDLEQPQQPQQPQQLPQ